MATETLTDTLQKTLELFDESGVPMTTSEVSESLDIGRRSTYNRLDRLVDQGRLETKKVGANGRVWWRPTSLPSINYSQRVPDCPATAQSLIDDVLTRSAVGVFVLDEDLHVAWINDATERYFGLDRERVIGLDNRELVSERIASVVEDSTAFVETVLATYEDNSSTEQFECHVTPGEGHEARWLEHQSKPIESGEFAGGRIELYFDVSARKQAERAHRRGREQFASLVDTVEGYAIFTLDPDGYVQTWNPGANRIKGYKEAEILGKHVSQFYTEEDRAAGVPAMNLKEAATEGSIETEGWRLRKDGSRFYAAVTITAIQHNGDLQGYSKVTRDMTERRAYERQLAEQAERLEQQRDDLKQELDDMFERVDDAFYALDEEYRFDYVNERAETIFGASESELLGHVIWEVLEVSDDDPIIERFETAVSTQEPMSFERYSDPLGIWNIVRVYPGESGLSVYLTDITERKQTEEALRSSEERFRALMEHSPFSMQIFDAEGRPIETNPAWERLWDASREELADYNLLQDVQLETGGLLPHIRDAFEGEVVTLPIIHYDPAEIGKPGRARWIEGYAYPLLSEDEEAVEIALVHHDVSERKERERELEQYETIVETVTDGVYAVDREYRFTMVNEAYADMVGYDHQTLLGTHISTVVGDDIASVGEQLRESLRLGPDDRGSVELEIETATGESITVETRYALLPSEDTFDGTAGIVRDVTERKERERELELYKTIVDAIDDGVYVLDEDFHFTEVNDTYAKMTGYDREDLIDAHCTLVIDEDVSDESARRLEEIIDGDATSAKLEADILRADGSHLRAESNFTAIETNDAEHALKVGVVRDVSDRVARERELTALNNLNEVFQDITDAVIEQSTREEIEEAVCAGLSGAESFSFAWIGEVDPATQTLDPRIETGVEGYFDAGVISVDRDDERSEGPGGQAFLTCEVQVARDIQTDERFDPWRDYVESYGIRSVAGVPIVYDDRVYGVLGVFADRPEAFAEAEQRVLGRLGEVAGQAIAAVERKLALMSDEVIELEFYLEDGLAAIGIDNSDEGRITLDQAVPISGEEYLVYGTATEEAWPALDELVDALPHWKAVSQLGEPWEGTHRFEVRMDEPPVLSTVASRGGYVESVRAEDGDIQLVAHLPPTGDVRAVREAITDEYPGSEMLAQRQISRGGRTTTELNRLLHEELTDRQRSALEVAYNTGFFEWPRESTGEEVADSLGVSPPTFHQHLRKAERKVFQTVLAARAPT